MLPFAVREGRLWLLLGQEADGSGWSPFGGKREADESVECTAVREAVEETLGVVGTPEVVARRTWWLRPLSRSGRHVTFGLPVVFDERLPDAFAFERSEYEAELRLQQRHDPLAHADGAGASPCLDKLQVAWVDAEQATLYDLRRPFAAELGRIVRELRARTTRWRQNHLVARDRGK